MWSQSYSCSTSLNIHPYLHLVLDYYVPTWTGDDLHFSNSHVCALERSSFARFIFLLSWSVWLDHERLISRFPQIISTLRETVQWDSFVLQLFWQLPQLSPPKEVLSQPQLLLSEELSTMLLRPQLPTQTAERLSWWTVKQTVRFCGDRAYVIVRTRKDPYGVMMLSAIEIFLRTTMVFYPNSLQKKVQKS